MDLYSRPDDAKNIKRITINLYAKEIIEKNEL